VFPALPPPSFRSGLSSTHRTPKSVGNGCPAPQRSTLPVAASHQKYQIFSYVRAEGQGLRFVLVLSEYLYVLHALLEVAARG
jgi:hypothetical protein